jgi:hypothetical protein
VARGSYSHLSNGVHVLSQDAAEALMEIYAISKKSRMGCLMSDGIDVDQLTGIGLVMVVGGGCDEPGAKFYKPTRLGRKIGDAMCEIGEWSLDGYDAFGKDEFIYKPGVFKCEMPGDRVFKPSFGMACATPTTELVC